MVLVYGVWHKRSRFRTQNRVDFLAPTEHVSGVVRITGSTAMGSERFQAEEATYTAISAKTINMVLT